MKNKGLRQYRFDSNPLEKKFAEKWEDQNVSHFTGDIDGRGTLDNLLSSNPSGQPVSGSVSDRDRVVAATVVQWLGSPVGQSFLSDVLGMQVSIYADVDGDGHGCLPRRIICSRCNGNGAVKHGPSFDLASLCWGCDGSGFQKS